jgi:hypothetical protein
MFGPASQERQAAPQRGPSQLRNEIRQTPSDDPGYLIEDEIQVPDSQTAIPDSQVEAEPLSPSTAALLNHNTAKRRTVLIAPTLFSRDKFAKGGSIGESTCPPPPFVGFPFAQPMQETDKSSSRLEKPALKAESHIPSTDQFKTISK